MVAVPVSPVAATALAPMAPTVPVTPPSSPAATSFASLLTQGVDRVNADIAHADQMVRAFVLDDSVPVHQVTFALSQAQLSLDLMLQIRNRVVDAYQQLSNMQL